MSDRTVLRPFLIGMDEDDYKEVLEKFGSTKVRYSWVHPNSHFEIISRIGHRGSWLFRDIETGKLYLTHTLNEFSKE